MSTIRHDIASLFLQPLVDADNIAGSSAALYGGEIHETTSQNFGQPLPPLAAPPLHFTGLSSGVRIGLIKGPFCPAASGEVMAIYRGKLEIICFSQVDADDSTTRGSAEQKAADIAGRVGLAIYNDHTLGGAVPDAFIDPEDGEISEGPSDSVDGQAFMVATFWVKFTEHDNTSA